jgi:hypothetical protein
VTLCASIVGITEGGLVDSTPIERAVEDTLIDSVAIEAVIGNAVGDTISDGRVMESGIVCVTVINAALQGSLPNGVVVKGARQS